MGKLKSFGRYLVGKDIIENNSNKARRAYMLFGRYFPLFAEAVSIKYLLEGDYLSSIVALAGGEIVRYTEPDRKSRNLIEDNRGLEAEVQ